MHTLNITTDCSYWHRGVERRDYTAGQAVETDDDEFAAVALDQGWADASGDKSVPAAPENKDAAKRRTTKAD